MLQTLSSPQPELYEDPNQGFDLARFLGIIRRRIFYFAVPFVLLLVIGFLVVAIQRPIYRAEGKILVESPEIPTTLVEPTVTAAATERLQVIQQRIMTRDNLLSIVKKFGLFPSEQQWMSGSQILDLMRERAAIQLVDIDTAISPTTKDGKPAPPKQQPFNNKTSSAIAFTMSFEYEKPELAMKVTNEFLTMILNEDVRARTNRATETTQFLAREVKRLQGELDSINMRIAEMNRQGGDPAAELKAQVDALTKMKTDLISTAAVYSEAHPRVKALQKRIAALEQQINQTPKTTPKPPQGRIDVDPLEEQQKSLARELESASKKLTAARLGESMERDQQAEHLQVIEQPALPQKPVKPKREKLFAIALALATMVGVGSVVTAEMLDKSIRGTRDLAGVVDSSLLVAIPYITTVGEVARRKRRIILLWVLLALLLITGVGVAFYVGVEIDFSWFDRSWLDALTRLTK